MKKKKYPVIERERSHYFLTKVIVEQSVSDVWRSVDRTTATIELAPRS